MEITYKASLLFCSRLVQSLFPRCFEESNMNVKTAQKIVVGLVSFLQSLKREHESTNKFLGVGKKFDYLSIRVNFFVFFSPDFSMKISNFSKTVHTISIRFCRVIIHPKGPLHAQRHQKRLGSENYCQN